MLCSTAIFIAINFAFIAGSQGQTTNVPSAEDVLHRAAEVANIPGLNTSAISIEEAKTAFERKCEINGGKEAFKKAENAAKEMESCSRDLVNVTVLQEEIESAKPTGDVDVVFRKYCNKSPKLKNCVKNFTDSVGACFTPKERENMRIIQNITDSLLNFVCFKEGDRIALFISAGGPECLMSRQSAINDCLNSTFSSYIPAEGLTAPSINGLDNFPLLLLSTKECNDIRTLQTCIVTDLEKSCPDPTPGNIVDALFNFIKKVTPCDNLLSNIRADSSIGDPSISSATVVGAQFMMIALLGFLTSRFF